MTDKSKSQAKERVYDLEERLLNYANNIIKLVEEMIIETEELIKIFFKSIQTAKSNIKKK